MITSNKNILGCMFTFFILILFTINAHAHDLVLNGDSPRFAISAKSIKAAINSLGYSVTESEDVNGNPHFVFDNPSQHVKSLSVFTADCGRAGCTDVVLYADFGKEVKINPEHLNNWNHVSGLKRSKAFRSGEINDLDGQVGLTLAISFLSDSEQEKLSIQTGLFLLEVGYFRALIDAL
jgi:hypothetical protein